MKEPVRGAQKIGRRRWLVGGAVVTAAALVVATWSLATIFQSPAQREANASPPPPQPVFAAVTTGILADQRSYSGALAYSEEASFTLPLAADAARSVVTGKPPTIGGTANSGDVLTEVNTRPVFVVASRFDFFRDIGFGDEGADVRMLQEALTKRGYLDGADGGYGVQTAQAVARWYRDAGYDAPTRQRTNPGTSSPPSSGSSGAPNNSESSGDGVTSSSPSEPEPVIDAFVPVSELQAVPSLPATIITAPGIGTHVGVDGAPDLTLGTSTLIVRAQVPSAEALGIAVGDSVTVTSPSGQVDAVVTALNTQPPADDGTPQPSVLTVSLGSDPAPLSAGRGDTVTVAVRNAVVAGESLVVPTAAVVGRGENRGVVVKRQSDGSLTEVPITVAGSLRGMTAVQPDGAGSLVEGDEIRVG